MKAPITAGIAPLPPKFGTADQGPAEQNLHCNRVSYGEN
jgi:hypothetical protein